MLKWTIQQAKIDLSQLLWTNKKKKPTKLANRNQKSFNYSFFFAVLEIKLNIEFQDQDKLSNNKIHDLDTYLTIKLQIIFFVCVGYEIVNSQLGTTSISSISNKRKWNNNCFIKNAK